MNLLMFSSSNGEEISPAELILHGHWKTQSNGFYSYVPGFVGFLVTYIMYTDLYSSPRGPAYIGV